jgi:predicted ATPase
LQNKDLNELFDLLSQGLNEEERTESPQRELAGKSSEDELNYHNVSCAQFASSSSRHHANNSPEGSERDKHYRIYSLGLLFYQLFSGGDLPPPELLVVSARDGSLSTISVSNPDEVGPSDTTYSDPPQSKRRQSSISNLSRRMSCQSRDQVICNVNVEYLRMKGVPGPLCDLVHNMIDAINGDFMGDESYAKMSDVCSDMKLMRDNPSVFLNGVDGIQLTQTGLQMDEKLFERDEDFKNLQQAYERAAAGSAELAVIAGASGTGKSTLANRLGDFVRLNGGYFLTGKFDQMEQVRPFSVASAFNKYIDLIMMEADTTHVRLIASKVHETLGQGVHHLTQMVPSLRKILTEHGFMDNHSEHAPNQLFVNSQLQFNYLFCQFVKVICGCSKGPLVLFIDDVQWADPVSVSLISQVLKTTQSMVNGNRLFFLGCCRNDVMLSGHHFWDMVDNLSSLGFTNTGVELDCMGNEAIKQMLSNLLHLTPRLVHSLAEIVYHKTKGNPLFVTRLLLSLNREGLLRINLARQRWEWDAESIQSRGLPDDVAAFFIQRITSLPTEARVTLCTLACFGASIECEVIDLIEESLGLKLIEPLDLIINEGLVCKRDGRYHFSHDRIQEVSYKMIEEPDRCLFHMKYGLCLVELALRHDNVPLLFTAVTQINIGGPPAVGEGHMYSIIANYNLLAGKKAMGFSEFTSAFSFFDNGITFLRKHHWQDQYELSLELFSLAAKCALAIKNVTSLVMLCDTIVRKGRTFEDTLDTSLVTMTFLANSKIFESVVYGISTLSQLGVFISELPSRDDILQQLSQTHQILDEMPGETILNHCIMTDRKQIMAMKILANDLVYCHLLQSKWSDLLFKTVW